MIFIFIGATFLAAALESVVIEKGQKIAYPNEDIVRVTVGVLFILTGFISSTFRAKFLGLDISIRVITGLCIMFIGIIFRFGIVPRIWPNFEPASVTDIPEEEHEQSLVASFEGEAPKE